MRNTRRARVVLAVLLLIAFTLITLDYRAGHGSLFGRLRTGASAVFGPIERAFGDVTRPIGNAFSSLGHLSSYKSEIKKLKAQNAQLNQQVRLSSDLRRQLDDRNRLLHLAGQGRFVIVPAQVIAVGPAFGFERTVTIDRGSSAGLRANMTVVNGSGLVGRTTNVGPNSSTVVLIADDSVRVGVRVEGGGQLGRISGDGLHALSLSLFDNEAVLRAGQRLVTYGDPGNAPYYPAVPVGFIRKVLTSTNGLVRTADVTPYVNFSTLDVVGVVVGQRGSVGPFSLLPPKPTTSPNPSTSPSTSSSTRPKRSPDASPSP